MQQAFETMNTNVDHIQYHILGVIHSLIKSYNLTIEQVSKHHEYILSFPEESLIHDYATMCDLQSRSDTNTTDTETASYAEHSDNSDADYEHERDHNPVYVSTRREFCNAMSKGIKICPRYSNCRNNRCKHFHIEQQYICPHVTRGAYCEQGNCELIVIRPCRKGSKCRDPECSFKH
jgi:hypothetical protein